MFGNYQHSELRIEVDANEQQLRTALTETANLRQWLWPQQLSAGMPGQLQEGTLFSSWSGPIEVQHHIDVLSSNGIRFVLSKGIDGYHEWFWGEGWIQSRLEGITLLPLNFGQTLTLLRLQLFLQQPKL
ncbi:MAG: hypothetical protein KTR27_16960 [Leptolyngbyaceae cyanobacterium MAG.088]|nr:hypothetical protein [Leptolyngbyaceae cyanobacterium MAG.088]